MSPGTNAPADDAAFEKWVEEALIVHMAKRCDCGELRPQKICSQALNIARALQKAHGSGRSSLAQRLADAESTLTDTLQALHDATERERALAEENGKLREALGLADETLELAVEHYAENHHGATPTKFVDAIEEIRALAATDK